MTHDEWVTLFRQMLEDVVENHPPPASVDTAGLADSLEWLNAALPAWIAGLRAHQGVETGLARLLAALDTMGVLHAGEFRTAVLALPGGAEKVARFLPMVISVMGAVRPAATGIPGGISGARGHII